MRLAVAGRDRDAARFAAQARAADVADRVTLLGGVDDVRPLYAAADCFILPTLYDPFPNAALEALAMGVPVIVSRRCGAAELVRAGENGWICEAQDSAGLAALLAAAATSARDERCRRRRERLRRGSESTMESSRGSTRDSAAARHEAQPRAGSCTSGC
jgi:UDP-glucose:(heptosyl)LPS alpha-1,3-glucosyltransferase